MKNLFFLAMLTCLLPLACNKSEPATNDNMPRSTSCNLSGRYFNMTILDKCPESMPVDVPHYALELDFKNDSVEISNGIEKFRLPYESTDVKCQYKIPAASHFGEMFFSVAGDSIVELIDTAWTKVNGNSTFRKNTSSARENWNFENFYNECMIAGTYSFTAKDGNVIPVYLLPNSQVSGLIPYLSYSLCYAGDCLEETEEQANIIEFFSDRGTKDLFVYKKTDDRSGVKFYKIGAPIADTKGNRKIGDLAFEIKAERVNN